MPLPLTRDITEMFKALRRAQQGGPIWAVEAATHAGTWTKEPAVARRDDYRTGGFNG